MSRTRNHRKRATKNKQYKKGCDTKRRKRDLDQIQDDLKKQEQVGKKIEFEADEDLPGMGQFYCTPCGRHFVNQETLEAHEKSKVHKRRLKDVAQKQYTHNEAEMGAGKTIEVLPPAHGPKPTKTSAAKEENDEDDEMDEDSNDDDEDDDV